ncbi:hypothetical protein [Metabacillus indicus]|uniref:hypothetical protein n=1 Tax=Metabacillus indicus TaxID=246786 RepID=UPI0004930E88|nr:hypothetical protein [Metabacillus indicus]KEZ49288.1 hypothetical protein AZ46_0214610 [Metabacillus indicus LMG 22858]
MKKVLLLFLTTMLAFTGGCGMTKEKDNGKVEQQYMPETEAFKDEFTREFIKSAEETEEGYYTFESKTKGYTMLFPENAKVSKSDYELHENKYETLNLGEKISDINNSYYIKLTYEKSPNINDIDVHLDQLSITSGYKGEFKEIDNGTNIVYYARENNNEKGLFYYIALIKANNTDQLIRLTFDSSCSNGETECDVDADKLEQRLMEVVNSIKFK